MTDIRERLRHGAKGAWFVVGGDADNMLEAADIIDKLVEALERLTARTESIADMVYNDNGDMTVTGYVTFDQITNVYWADKRAREALNLVKGEQQ